MPYSCNRPKGKRATQFKKGFNSRLMFPRTTVSPTEDVQTNEAVCEERLTLREAKDLNSVTGTQCDDSLPYRLRPKPEREEDFGEHTSLDENLIVNAGRLCDLMNNVRHKKSCKLANVKLNIDKRMGLCIFVSVRCKTCRLKSQTIQLTDTVAGARGPPAGALNTMLVLSILKSKVGIQDARTLLTCLNVQPPSTRMMQRKLNQVSDQMTELNETQMVKNQEYVKRILTLAGTTPATDVQFDVSYSNRPRGECQSATQSFGAMIDHPTGLPLAVGVANKNCRIPGCKHKNCSKTYPTEKTMASSERDILLELLKALEEKGLLTIKSLTTDASNQEGRAYKDYFELSGRDVPPHYLCLVHRLRSLAKMLRNLQLKSIPQGCDKAFYKQKLASAVRSRIRVELMKLSKLLTQAEFAQKGSACAAIITKCFSGDHSMCAETSNVCFAHCYENYSVNHLPYAKYLELSDTDLQTIQSKINRYFGPKGCERIAQRLYNTNLVESLHSAVYTITTKRVHYARNFAPQCHSAAHSLSLGPGRSTLELAVASGITVLPNSAMYLTLMKKDAIRAYYAARQKTSEFKRARWIHRKRKASAPLLKTSVYSADNMPSTSTSDHSYGATS